MPAPSRAKIKRVCRRFFRSWGGDGDQVHIYEPEMDARREGSVAGLEFDATKRAIDLPGQALARRAWSPAGVASGFGLAQHLIDRDLDTGRRGGSWL